MNRRQFLTRGAAATAALGTPLGAIAEAVAGLAVPAPKAVQKISSQEPIIPGRDLDEKLDNMEKWGFDGIEFWGGPGLANNLSNVQRSLKNHKIKISAVCAGYEGVIISDQQPERDKANRTLKEILTVAGELGATGVVCVPAFNGQTKLDFVEGRKVLIDQLKDIGEHAVKVKSRLLIEPLDRYEAWFLRLLSDGAAIVKDVDSEGVRMMGDMYHMGIEETSDEGAFLSAAKYVHHVHLASYKRNLPGQDERDFKSGFKGLKTIGYQDFMSLECGVIGDKMVEIPKAVKFLRKQWKDA